MRIRSLLPWFLLPSILCAQDPAPVPDAAELVQAFERARTTWNEAYRAADGEGRRALLAERPEHAFLPRFQRAAADCRGRDEAVPFLVWIVRHGDGDAVREAMDAIVADHVEHRDIRLAVARLGGLHGQLGLEATRAWLDRVVAASPHADVLVQARYTRAALYVGTRAAQRSDELRRFAIAELRAVLEDTASSSLQGLAKGLLFEAERLEPGLVAPEIEGEDLDGVSFRLSDYRGKVVLLDFWGDW